MSSNLPVLCHCMNLRHQLSNLYVGLEPPLNLNHRQMQLILRCNVTAQWSNGSQFFPLHNLFNGRLRQSYLLHVFDNIFMRCRESAGRHSHIHFTYGDVRVQTQTQWSMHCTHTHTHIEGCFRVMLTAAICVCMWLTHPRHVFEHHLSRRSVTVLPSEFVPLGFIYFCQLDGECVQ